MADGRLPRWPRNFPNSRNRFPHSARQTPTRRATLQPVAMPARIPQSDQTSALLFHARAATLFPSADGELCASVPSSIDARRVFPLRSAEFRDWLTANYYSEFESCPSPGALRSVLHTLEARAQYGDWP